jgi:eukaryotic-like serine/threonine-protein kinase
MDNGPDVAASGVDQGRTPMTPERWQQVRAMLAGALERAPADRAAYLDQVSVEPSLRREVESLLAQEKGAEGFLEAPALEVAAQMLGKSPGQSLLGAQIGSYQVLSLLGVGGMGEVYQAHDTKLGRDVAIKVLPSAFVHDPDRLSRFQREARMLASLNHPNIATIFGLEQSDGVNYLVMELVPGETLAERVNAGALKIEEGLKLGGQIAEALEAAHERGVIHRDLKPANVKVTPEGRVKVLDFGLAKAFAGDSGLDLSNAPTLTAMGTEEGRILGTPAYMSPEQARGKPVDKRTDIWAFGCVLYELLTGKVAFRGETVSDTLAAVLEREPDLQALPPATPAKIRDLLRRSLQKDFQRRLRDIGDARIEIEEALTAPPVTEPTFAAIPRRAGWRREILWGITSLLLAGLAVGFVSLTRRPAEPPVYHQLTFRRGTIRTARFAPDGQTIVYSASFEGHGSQTFWARSDSPESTILPFPNTVVHSVSSSGELAIGIRRGSTVTLAEVALAGGAPREILEGPNGFGADWAPDGQNLAIIHTVGDHDRIEFPVGKVLYDPGPGVGLGFIRFSPRGDLIAFVENNSINVVDLNGKHRVVSGGWADAIGLAWNPVSGEIWFTARGGESSGGLVLHAVSLSGKQRVVARVPGILLIQDIARDGRVLLKQAQWPTSMICLSPGSSKEVDLSWFDFSHGKGLSDDGKSILFDEEGIAAGGKGGVYLRGTDGSPAIHLNEGNAVGLSPDGKWALAGDSRGLVLLPVGAGQSRVLNTEGLEFHSAGWFPGGKRILLSAAQYGHPPRLYVQEIEGGTPHPITPEGVEIGPVSPDGNSVMGRGPGPAVFLYPVSGGAPRAVPGVEPDDRLIRWDTEGKKLFLARVEGPASLSIYRFDPASGQRELWKKLAPADSTGLGNFSDAADNVLLTPDGKVYSYSFMRDLSYLFVVEGLK